MTSIIDRVLQTRIVAVVRLEQYDTVSTALIWAIGQALGADFDPATREAWRVALADVCAAMKEGAEEP